MSVNSRTVTDSFGSIDVPYDRLYGAQTERSRRNFNICSQNDRMPIQIVHALAMIKDVASRVNLNCQLISSIKSDAIGKACREIYQGKLNNDEFPLVIWQTGSGTQTNMNVNEVVAYRASQLLTDHKLTIHPNDDVNLGQVRCILFIISIKSSNDTFPTAMNLSVAIQTSWNVLPALDYLYTCLTDKMNEYMQIVKIGRTHMQDAVPLTVGQELSGYANQLEQVIDSIKRQLPFVCQLAIGGTAVGTGLNAVKGFSERVCQELTLLVRTMAQENGVEYTPSVALEFTPAPNKFAALAGHDALLQLSGCFNTVATVFNRLACDFTLLSSGPNCGLNEFELPANEPGSSIMPGKVNPTQCESMRMVSVQLMANHFATTLACAQGQLELNVYKPLIASKLLHSCSLIGDSARSFVTNCLKDMRLNVSQIDDYVDKCVMLVTALNPHIGYDSAARLAKFAQKNRITLRQAAVQMDLMDELTFDSIVKPQQMAFPFDQ